MFIIAFRNVIRYLIRATNCISNCVNSWLPLFHVIDKCSPDCYYIFHFSRSTTIFLVCQKSFTITLLEAYCMTLKMFRSNRIWHVIMINVINQSQFFIEYTKRMYTIKVTKLLRIEGFIMILILFLNKSMQNGKK